MAEQRRALQDSPGSTPSARTHHSWMSLEWFWSVNKRCQASLYLAEEARRLWHHTTNFYKPARLGFKQLWLAEANNKIKKILWPSRAVGCKRLRQMHLEWKTMRNGCFGRRQLWWESWQTFTLMQCKSIIWAPSPCGWKSGAKVDCVPVWTLDDSDVWVMQLLIPPLQKVHCQDIKRPLGDRGVISVLLSAIFIFISWYFCVAAWPQVQ